MQALDDYIMKKNNDAILDVVSSSLDRIQRQLARDQAVQDVNSITPGVSRARETLEKQKPKIASASNNNSNATFGLIGTSAKSSSSTARVNDMDMDIDDVEPAAAPAAKKKAATSRSTSSKATSNKAAASDNTRKSSRATKVRV